jgi:hypothetical protein
MILERSGSGHVKEAMKFLNYDVKAMMVGCGGVVVVVCSSLGRSERAFCLTFSFYHCTIKLVNN